MDKNCIGCGHYYAYFRLNLCCNYIFDEGHMRPCPPGAECTVKQPRQNAGAKCIKKSSKKSDQDPQNKENV